MHLQNDLLLEGFTSSDLARVCRAARLTVRGFSKKLELAPRTLVAGTIENVLERRDARAQAVRSELAQIWSEKEPETCAALQEEVKALSGQPDEALVTWGVDLGRRLGPVRAIQALMFGGVLAGEAAPRLRDPEVLGEIVRKLNESAVGVHPGDASGAGVCESPASRKVSESAVGVHPGDASAAGVCESPASRKVSESAVGGHPGDASGAGEREAPASRKVSESAVGGHPGDASGAGEREAPAGRKSESAVGGHPGDASGAGEREAPASRKSESAVGGDAGVFSTARVPGDSSGVDKAGGPAMTRSMGVDEGVTPGAAGSVQATRPKTAAAQAKEMRRAAQVKELQQTVKRQKEEIQALQRQLAVFQERTAALNRSLAELRANQIAAVAAVEEVEPRARVRRLVKALFEALRERADLEAEVTRLRAQRAERSPSPDESGE